MGIRCLTKFVNQYFKGWEKSPVKGKLIIDGFALFYTLFEEYSTEQSEIYGGDYVTIAREMSKFLQTLVEAGINPLVVLDGTFDFDKLDTIADRAKEKMKVIVGQLGTHNHEVLGNEPLPINKQSGMSKSHATPYLSANAIIDSVKRVLGDNHLFVADCDADVDIACLAIHHQCPVLSNDSDFYIFPLLYGYIPYSRFYWRDANSNFIIYGELYFYQLFCKQFEICDTSLLTIIPVIVGNDTITRLDIKYRKMIMPKDVYARMLIIENAVKYVASFKTFEGCLTSLRKQKLFSMIENIQHAYYDYFFLPLFKPRTSFITRARCKDGSCIPSFVMKKYRQGVFLPFVIDTLWIHAVCFNMAIEDMLSESWCCLIGVPIRRAIYGILCGNDACILENQRKACAISYEAVEITSITHTTYDGKQIPLPTLQCCCLELDREYGKKILYGILDARKEYFKKIPKDYQLVLVTTRYWYKHCTITKKRALLKSFVLLVQLSIEHKIEKCLLIRALYKPIRPLFPIASFTHAFAQWQSLYRDIQCLNELLQEPLKLLPISDFLECSYLYHLVEAVMKGGVSQIVKQYCLNQKTYQMFYAVANPARELPVQVKRK